MRWYGKSKFFCPERQYLAVEEGKTVRCAVFCMGKKDVPRLLRWIKSQAAPVLALRRGEDGRVTVVLGAQPEEDANGKRTVGTGGAFPAD